MFWPFRRARPRRKAGTGGRRQRLLVVCHREDADGLSVMDNLCAGFALARLDFSVLDIGVTAAWPDLRSFAAVVICTENVGGVPDRVASDLEAYVRGGGGVLVAFRCMAAPLAGLFGLAIPAAPPRFHVTSGLIVEEDMFPGTRGLTIADEDWALEHDRFDVGRGDLSPDAIVLASDGEARPVVWRRTCGAGTVVYWNTGVLAGRALRGFGVQSALDAMRIGVSAMGGFAMFHIDDFPPSISAVRQEPLATEFPDLDWTGFAFDVWQHDIRDLAAKFDLRYTWYTVMNYHDVDNRAGADMSAPAVADGLRVLRERFARIGAIPDGDEYGFHGYNHDPIIAASWPKPDALKAKFQCARAMWKSAVPAPMPESWVPANNWYHPRHVRILKDVFPEIATVCGLFSTSRTELGGFRDFGPEPWEPTLLCLPRETFGYVQTPALRLLMLSQIAGLGVWTHFIHPDDIVDIPRPGVDGGYCRNPDALMWRACNAAGTPGLLSRLEDWVGEVRTRFPWMTFLTTSQAVAAWRGHMESAFTVEIFDGNIEVTGNGGMRICVRTDPETQVHCLDASTIVHMDEYPLFNLYVISLSDGKASIGCRRKTKS